MGPLIRVPENMFRLVEKRLKYRFWDKERERSNHAMRLHEAGMRAPVCIRHHDTIGWVGPPHDTIRAYVCLHCNGWACEPEIRDHGYTFDEVPDWIIKEIMDLDLKRQAMGNPKTFFMGR